MIFTVVNVNICASVRVSNLADNDVYMYNDDDLF